MLLRRFVLIAENPHYRIYAVTLKNIPITIGFAVITASQLGLGICLVVFAAREGGATEPLHQENIFLI